MEVESFDKSAERRILIGMITDDNIVASVASVWDKYDKAGLFRNKVSNLIARWCIFYHEKHGKAINGNIRFRFEEHVRESNNEEQNQIIADILSSLDFESEHSPVQNAEYLIDQASKYFTEVRLERIADKIKIGIENGKIEDSLDAVNSFNRVELGADLGIDPIRNEPAIRQAFESVGERLIKFAEPELEDAAMFFGDTFSRDSLVGFLAAEKSGKSMILLDLIVRAVKQGRKVAYFEVGDMSQSQVMLRLMQNILGRPKKAKIVNIPTRIEFDKKYNADVTTVAKNHKEALSADYVMRRFSEFIGLLENTYGVGCELLRLSCHPSGSINVMGIESRLDTWERSGWMPDIVVIDYADILAPIDNRQEKRHQVDETWKRLRGLSQARHICVITATQADAASYRAKTLDKSNFSESKTKLAHVNAFIGINATFVERDKQIRRLNYIVRREEAYSEQECLYIAGCWSICRPMLIAANPTFGR